jgi:WD40 repeat protein
VTEGWARVSRRLRIFLSSPNDVKSAREIAAQTIERLAQDYARFVAIEPYLWEYEAWVASGHYQDAIEPPSAFDIVVLILWSRLGTLLPERTRSREYRGIDGRAPVTGSEWEYEEALKAARETGTPDILVYRSRQDARIKSMDSDGRRKDFEQLEALDRFWSRHFSNQGTYLGAYTEFVSDAEFAAAFESNLRKLIEKRIASLTSSQSEQSARIWMHEPFRGLESYEFEHAPIFFGQDEALARAMVQLVENADAGSPFLLVLGASGSGKSSLVKAGIVPKLFVPRRIPGAAFLRRVVFRPSDAQAGEDLFDALARRLTTQVGPDEGLSELIAPGQSLASLAAHLRNASGEPAYPIGTALAHLAARTRNGGRMLEYETARLVLVIDQLEELFTNELLTQEERQRFIALLAGLVHSGLVWVIATMRKDFWHQADETPGLVALAQGNGRLELLPPTQSQLSQMIRRPATAAGVGFERHEASDVPLNEVIAEEVAREPGALPLLSYLMDQLYRVDVLEAHGNVLTYATYEKLGRLEGAIATRAEAVLEACAPEDRTALGSVLFALVQMSTADGDIERAVSRRVPLANFPAGTPQRRLVEALLHPDARLVVSDADAGGHPTVRVAHEALITRWERARDFVAGNAQALKIRRRIEERYALWHGLDGRDSDSANKNEAWRTAFAAWRARFGHEAGLLSEIDLIDGQRLLREHRSETEPHLVDYIERSVADDRRMRSRTVRVLSIVASVVTVLAIFASVAGLIALQKQHEAEAQTQRTLEAQSRLLTEAAAERLKEGSVGEAQSIILPVLTENRLSEGRSASAINVFQEARAVDSQLIILFGPDAFLASAAWSPDGRRIVTASWDKTARIWDAATGRQLAVLSGHRSSLMSAAFSPDGRRIVTASGDKTARIWDAATGKQLGVLSGHRSIVRSASVSPDGLHVVTASGDGTARIWDTATGKQLAVLVIPGHEVYVFSAAFSPDGRHIVTASDDRIARIWDAATGKQLVLLSGHDGSVLSAAYSRDGRRIVTASSDKTARIWDAATGKQLTVLSGHNEGVNGAAWSPDGRQVATASDDKTARVWDATSGKQLAVLSGHSNQLISAAFSPDGQRIVTASWDKTARIWDVATVKQLVTLTGHDKPVQSAAWSFDGRRVVTASADTTARIWNATTGKQLVLLSGHHSQVWSGVFSPDGRRVLTASSDGTARSWGAATGKSLIVFSGHQSAVEYAEWSPDSRHIVTASDDRTARIWDAATGKQITVLSGHENNVLFAAWSPDGTRIATGSFDRTVRIWDATTGQQLAVLSGHDDLVVGTVWSPDGRRIVSASADKTARIWDAASAKQLVVLSGHDMGVTSVAFSPDGRRVVTASQDRTARIWDAATGQQLAVLAGHDNFLESAAWSPDGRRIATASDDKTARIWDARIPAGLDAQIAWSEAAQVDALTSVEQAQLGLPPDERIRTWPGTAQKCDLAAASFLDPGRLAPGLAQITADVAVPTCAQETASPGSSPRFEYQYGRALLARHDVSGARRKFETAVSGGYRAAQIDLANLFADPSAGMLDPARAVSLYEKAWNDGVPIAAYQLGQVYEHGLHGTGAQSALRPDNAKAWAWYQKGADIGEPDALARFAEREDENAVAENSAAKRDAVLLSAFRTYAAAAERAQDEDWPDDAWKNWRYRRATIARLLARDGMMQQVADAYTQMRDKWKPHPPTWIESLRASLGL